MKDEKVNILTGEYVSLSFEKAELAQRIGAVLLDWIVLFLFCMFLERMDRNVLPHKLVLVIASMVPFFNLFLEEIQHGFHDRSPRAAEQSGTSSRFVSGEITETSLK